MVYVDGPAPPYVAAVRQGLPERAFAGPDDGQEHRGTASRSLRHTTASLEQGVASFVS